MQKNSTPDKRKKSKVKPVRKPYETGTVFSKTAFKNSFKMLAYQLLFAFFFLLLGTAFSFEGSSVIRIFSNIILVLACAAFVFIEGARAGENEVAYGEIIYQRKESGKTIDKKDLDRCYNGVKPILTVLVGTSIMLIISLIYALTAQKQTYALQALPNWLSAYGQDAEIMQPLQYYYDTAQMSLMDYVRPVIRICVYPYINIVGIRNTDGMLLVDRLSPLLILLPYLAYIVAYWQGPRGRALVHGSIASNQKRHKRAEKRARKARVAKKNELI